MSKKLLWSTGTFLVIGVLLFSHFWKESTENISAKEQVEMYYDVYNEKDFESYYNMLSEREKEKIEEIKIYSDSSEISQIDSEKRDKEEILKIFEQAWRSLKVIEIEEQSGGTEKGTIVSATIHYPASGTNPEATAIETFKLIKENGEWKFDDFLSKEFIE